MDPSASSLDINRPGYAGSLRVFRTSTNRPLSDLERRMVRPFIERAQQKLALCLNPPASLRGALDMQAMSQVALKLQEYIYHHQALISPLRHFPPEVLSEIFLHLSPNYNCNDKLLDLPMFLGRICSYWRQVALSTPRLWSTIRVDINEGTERSRCELIKLLTVRSGACLLDVDYYHPGGWTQDAQCCLEEILRSSSRWHTVELYLPSIAYGSLSKIKHSLPELRSILLEPTTTMDVGVALPLCDAFAAAPRLSEMITVGTDMIFVAPWATLEMYKVRWVDDSRYMQWLGQCTRLVEAEISFQNGAFPDVAVSAHLPCLEILSLCGSTLGLLNSLTTPVLDRIEFIRFEHIDPSVLASLVARSKCQISELVIKQTLDISDVDLIACIRILPALYTLIVHTDEEQPSPLTNSFMEALTLLTDDESNGSADPLALQLSILEFAGELAEDCDEELLLLLVFSRPSIDVLNVEDIELDETTTSALEQYHADEGLRYYNGDLYEYLE